MTNMNQPMYYADGGTWHKIETLADCVKAETAYEHSLDPYGMHRLAIEAAGFHIMGQDGVNYTFIDADDFILRVPLEVEGWPNFNPLIWFANNKKNYPSVKSFATMDLTKYNYYDIFKKHIEDNDLTVTVEDEEYIQGSLCYTMNIKGRRRHDIVYYTGQNPLIVWAAGKHYDKYADDIEETVGRCNYLSRENATLKKKMNALINQLSAAQDIEDVRAAAEAAKSAKAGDYYV